MAAILFYKSTIIISQARRKYVRRICLDTHRILSEKYIHHLWVVRVFFIPKTANFLPQFACFN